MDRMQLSRLRPSTLQGSQLARRLLSGSWADAETRKRRARELAAQGYSYGDIAHRLDVTRNQARWLTISDRVAGRAKGLPPERREKQQDFAKAVREATGLTLDSYYLVRRTAIERAVEQERDPVDLMKEMGCWIEGRTRPPSLRTLDSVRAALMKRRAS